MTGRNAHPTARFSDRLLADKGCIGYERTDSQSPVRGWFDGRLVIDHTDVVLGSTDFPNMRFDHFLLAPYFGPGLLPHAQKQWIDELAVGTQVRGVAWLAEPADGSVRASQSPSSISRSAASACVSPRRSRSSRSSLAVRPRVLPTTGSDQLDDAPFIRGRSHCSMACRHRSTGHWSVGTMKSASAGSS